MRTFVTANMATCLLAFNLLASSIQAEESDATRFCNWGKQTLDAVERDLKQSHGNGYIEIQGDPSSSALQPVFMWGAGVQLSALTAAAKCDSNRYREPMEQYANSLEEYWAIQRGIGGYDVLPRSPKTDRYYDDNAWMVLALLEVYDITKQPVYLHRAQRTFHLVQSGEDETLGGGIFWRENRRRTKNACATAPAIVAALRLHSESNNATQLATAKRLYRWINSKLQDPVDGLYWDNIRRNGRVDRRKFSYNTALMIRANCLLYKVKQDQAFLSEATRLSDAAVRHWIDSSTGAVKDEGRFGHLLLGALLAVDQVVGEPKYRPLVSKSIAFVHSHLRDSAGHYPRRWDRPTSEVIRKYSLIDQASAARAFFEAASNCPTR